MATHLEPGTKVKIVGTKKTGVVKEFTPFHGHDVKIDGTGKVEVYPFKSLEVMSKKPAGKSAEEPEEKPAKKASAKSSKKASKPKEEEPEEEEGGEEGGEEESEEEAGGEETTEELIERLSGLMNEGKKAKSVQALEAALEELDDDVVSGLDELQSAIEEFNGIEKEGMTPADYQEERGNAFEAITEAIDALEVLPPEDEPEEDEPKPKKKSKK